jgi:hypothetical protein
MKKKKEAKRWKHQQNIQRPHTGAQLQKSFVVLRFNKQVVV